jgi:hypothetical protein
MLDRAYFERRQELTQAAVVDYRQRRHDLELKLVEQFPSPTREERLTLEAKLRENQGMLRWSQGHDAEVSQALRELDRQDGEQA